MLEVSVAGPSLTWRLKDKNGKEKEGICCNWQCNLKWSKEQKILFLNRCFCLEDTVKMHPMVINYESSYVMI